MPQLLLVRCVPVRTAAAVWWWVRYCTTCVIILATTLLPNSVMAASDFDPYVMNGGLIAAIAGRDYIVIATDTRISSVHQSLHKR
jgi:20S proteasome alpha/beta subunit